VRASTHRLLPNRTCFRISDQRPALLTGSVSHAGKNRVLTNPLDPNTQTFTRDGSYTTRRGTAADFEESGQVHAFDKRRASVPAMLETIDRDTLWSLARHRQISRRVS
jgi:hypothetical protein